MECEKTLVACGIFYLKFFKIMIYREGEVRYLTGLISQSKSVRFRPYATNNKHRGIEQLAARVAHNHKVGGSSPSPATN